MPAEPESTPRAATSLVERLRAVHLQMLDAVLTGDGLAAVADLAAEAAGGPVAIVVSRLGVAVASGGGAPAPAGAVALCADRPPERPRHVVARLAAESAGALAQHIGGGPAGRVFAVLRA